MKVKYYETYFQADLTDKLIPTFLNKPQSNPDTLLDDVPLWGEVPC